MNELSEYRNKVLKHLHNDEIQLMDANDEELIVIGFEDTDYASNVANEISRRVQSLLSTV